MVYMYLKITLRSVFYLKNNILLGKIKYLCYNKTCQLNCTGVDMATDIFRRVEKKYLLTRDDYESLMDRIWFYIKEDTYFKSNISNIYYDSCDNELIINSIDKPVFKEKVRARR